MDSRKTVLLAILAAALMVAVSIGCATVVNNTGVAAAGVAFYIIGSCAVTASIVCLGVGYARMHNSADIYMANYNNARKPQAYLQLQTSKDGLGLALKF